MWGRYPPQCRVQQRLRSEASIESAPQVLLSVTLHGVVLAIAGRGRRVRGSCCGHRRGITPSRPAPARHVVASRVATSGHPFRVGSPSRHCVSVQRHRKYRLQRRTDRQSAARAVWAAGLLRQLCGSHRVCGVLVAPANTDKPIVVSLAASGWDNQRYKSSRKLHVRFCAAACVLQQRPGLLVGGCLPGGRVHLRRMVARRPLRNPEPRAG